MIDEKALYDAIISGHVAGAALDVLEVEPNFTKAPEEQDFWNPLLDLDQVIITPHLGASTKEATLNCSLGVAQNVEAVLNGEPIAAVNMPPVAGDMDEPKPYIDLGENWELFIIRLKRRECTSLKLYTAVTLLTSPQRW